MFRREVSTNRGQSWLGRIVLIRPPSFSALAACTGLMAVALFAFLSEASFTRRERVQGQLAPVRGVVKVHVRQPCVVQELLVREGDRVARGQPLVTVADARYSLADGTISEGVAEGYRNRFHALEARRAQTLEAQRRERQSLVERGERLRAELAQIDATMPLLEKRVALALREKDRTGQLVAGRFVSPSYVDRKTDEGLEHEIRFLGLQRERLALLRELGSTESELRIAQARFLTQLSAIDGERAALDQERIERNAQYRSTIAAPEAGTVAVVLAQEGMAVSPEAPLLAIVPEDAVLEAHLFAPSRSIGFVRQGQEVLLRYRAFPHQKFGSYRARVLRVSRTALSPTEIGFAPPDGSRDGLFRITATLASQDVMAYGRPEPLQAGMQVEADVLIDRRRLIEWIFEPLYSLAGRL